MRMARTRRFNTGTVPNLLLIYCFTAALLEAWLRAQEADEDEDGEEDKEVQYWHINTGTVPNLLLICCFTAALLLLLCFGSEG
jgi:hypothetical protein